MISKIRISKTEKRVILILMIINSFALFTNYFGISYKINDTSELFTKSVGIQESYRTDIHDEGNYLTTNKEHFYPFVDFYDGYYKTYTFRGIFAFYDTTEFFVYTLVIFGIVLIRRIW